MQNKIATAIKYMQRFSKLLIGEKKTVRFTAFRLAKIKTKQNKAIISLAGWDISKEALFHIAGKNMTFLEF